MTERLDPAELGTVVGVWAHPDDEAYLMAGTALTASAGGSRVVCVTATAGEAGETADEERWPRAELGSIRRAEMAECMRILGVDAHHWLDLPDGSLAEVGHEHGVELVVAVLEAERPDTVLTFGADGMTGHPDHVAIGTWTHEAVRRFGLDCRVLAPTNTQAWYDAWPDLTAAVFPDGGPVAAPDDLAMVVELSPELASRKVEALRAQASQTSGIVDALGVESYGRWVGTEHWVRRPHP